MSKTRLDIRIEGFDAGYAACLDALHSWVECDDCYTFEREAARKFHDRIGSEQEDEKALYLSELMTQWGRDEEAEKYSNEFTRLTDGGGKGRAI